MRKMGYVTLQRAIERRLKANNKAREALGMELKEPLVAFSDDVVYITDNFSMFFIIPKSEYILPYKPNTDERTFEKYARKETWFTLWYENEATDVNEPKRDLYRYCSYHKSYSGKIESVTKVYFIKDLLQRFYKNIHKLHLSNDGSKHGVTHVYKNGILIGVIAPFMKD